MINKKFSYIKAIVCGVLALSCVTKTFAASEDQMGVTVRVGGGMLIPGMLKTELKEINLLPLFAEKTKKSATATSTEDNNDVSSKSSLSSATDGDVSKSKNKLTLENPIIGFLSVNYDIISAGLEGGFTLSAGIEGNIMSGHKMTSEIADGQLINVQGGDLNSGDIDLVLKANAYKTANGAANNKFVIEQNIGGGAGIVVNTGYAINDSVEVRFGGAARLFVSKYKISGSNDLISSDATNAFSHALKSSFTSDDSPMCYSFNGALNVGFVFKLTEFVDVNLQGGVSMFTEVKPKFANVTLTSSESTFKVNTVPAGMASTLTKAAFDASTEKRYYGAATKNAANQQDEYKLLAKDDTVVHKGTGIKEIKIADIEQTIPSIVYAELKFSVGFTF